jgi:tetratricopeptide (TPR) repeat protein
MRAVAIFHRGGALRYAERRQARAGRGAIVKQWTYALAGAAMALATAMPVKPAAALTQQQIDACVNRDHNFSLDEQIGGCTASIQSGRWSGKDLGWAYANRCIAYKDQKQYDRAMTDCNQAIRLDPRNDHAFNTRGVIYHLTEKYDQAIEQYSRAIQLNPNFLDPHHNRGMSYAAKGDYDTAIADYNAALKINPRDALALFERGVAKQKKGDEAGGRADVDAARQIEPKMGD